MGFRKSMMPTEIVVELNFRHMHTDTGEVELLSVKHIFMVPPPEVRDEYQRRLVKVRGKNIKPSASEAAFYLWHKCVLRVEGYDDLPAPPVDWKTYFHDAVGRIHLEQATDRFLEMIGLEEAEEAKKFGPSSEV